MIGVYAIVHRATERRYIGSSNAIENRWRQHVSELSRGKHHSSHLQNAWRKYGAEAFDFVVLEICGADERCDREQAWLDVTRSADAAYGFNHSMTAHVATPSVEGRARISASRKGKTFGPRAPEVGRKIAASLRGKPQTAERRAKISAALMGKTKGRPHSSEHTEKIRLASARYRHSDESRQKIVANHWSRRPDAADIIHRSNEKRAQARAQRRATLEVA